MWLALMFMFGMCAMAAFLDHVNKKDKEAREAAERRQATTSYPDLSDANLDRLGLTETQRNLSRYFATGNEKYLNAAVKSKE